MTFDIEQLRRLHAATTQGEWIASVEYDVIRTFVNGQFQYPVNAVGNENCEFIAAAHNAMPALLDEIERLQTELDKQVKNAVEVEREACANIAMQLALATPTQISEAIRTRGDDSGE